MKKKLNCILLIDDDEPTNYLNKVTLEEAGCTDHVHVTQSGQEALDYLSGDSSSDKAADRPLHPELIFLDINMPAMDGWEFLNKYKSLPRDRKGEIIVIMLTTSLNPDDEIRTRMIPEIAGFENKPLTLPIIEGIINRHFPEYL